MRQIHLDFHTSPHIGGIGADFSREEFAATLKDANVAWINLFAKCHHGMFYYPTKLGTVHPNLKFDLLGEQARACRENGIKIGMYTCVGWNEDWADRHPEWMEVSPDGTLGARKPFSSQYTSWRKLCLNNMDYRKIIKEELLEEYEIFKPDGYWIDIIIQGMCICPACVSGMKRQNLDPESEADTSRYAKTVVLDYMEDIYGYIKTFAPQTHVYFNCNPYETDLADDKAIAGKNRRKYVTHIDVESLPNEYWGYTHFPVAMNYINGKEADITMMNGKFHSSWGDFGSLRNKEALEYECFRALANGAGICVGDQLHPTGRLDPTAYRRIGEVFEKVREKEPWCEGTEKISQIGVYTAKLSGAQPKESAAADLAAEGAYRILTELKYNFDFIDADDELAAYELVVLPDLVVIDEKTALRINEYVSSGGKVLFSSISAVRDGRFLIEDAGVTYLGPAEYNPRYMRIGPDNFPGIPPMDYCVYERGADVAAMGGAQVLARIINPYFNRSYERFCSHRQTPPNDADTGLAAITRKGGVTYIAAPLFTDYAVNRVSAYREIISRLILGAGIKPLIATDLPSFAETTLRRKGSQTILHILNYIIEHKSHTLDTIEETLPLYGRHVSVRLPVKPARAFLAPEKREIGFAWDDEYARFEPERIGGHEMIVIE